MHHIVPWRKPAGGGQPLTEDWCSEAPENWEEVKLGFRGYFLDADAVQRHTSCAIPTALNEPADDATTRYKRLWAELKAVPHLETQMVEQTLATAILEHGLLPHLAQRQGQYDFATTLQQA